MVGVAIAAVAVVMCCTLTMNTAAAQGRVSCDRTCLTELLDRYLDALVARDPHATARTVKPTENGQRLDLGDGLWHTVTGKGSYRLDMADVEASQAVVMGTIREAETPAIIVLRLGVVEQRIAEIETLVIRNKDAAENLDKIATPRRAWYTAVPEGERHSRRSARRQHVFLGHPADRRQGRVSSARVVRTSRERIGDRRRSCPGAGRTADAAPIAVDRAARSSFSPACFSTSRGSATDASWRSTRCGIAFVSAFFDNGSGDARNGTLSDGRKVSSGADTCGPGRSLSSSRSKRD